MKGFAEHLQPAGKGSAATEIPIFSYLFIHSLPLTSFHLFIGSE